tara:strand:+ start:355 stop:582 length:228 start_codon:yes stop_codon:yes gene_type:complete
MNKNNDNVFIFESPDNGITIYRRKFGSLKRELISKNKNKISKNNESIKHEPEPEPEPKSEPANKTSVNFAWWYSQ